MKIGITAATSFEIESTIQHLSVQSAAAVHEYEILITGIGSMVTTYQLTNFIKNKSPQFMIQAGIGGSFNPHFQLGDSFLITDEVVGDLGVAENNSIQDLFDMGFMDVNAEPFFNRALSNPGTLNWAHYGLPLAHGLTVNQITTDTNRITLLRDKYHCDIESMEGAAFHYVCLMEKLPFIQLRAISNKVGERNKKNWRFKESIASLNMALIKIIQEIS